MTDKTIWFPAKKYGWGWTFPCRWQGWATLAAYLICMVLWAFSIDIESSWGLYIGGVVVLSAALMGVCWLKGEPAKWRWGETKRITSRDS